MHCTACGVWDLGRGDLVCSSCGASYLHFTVSLEPAALPVEDYPPPVALHVRNDSPLGAITLERIYTGTGWMTLLPGQPLPQLLAPGIEHTFAMDVDTFAAGAERQVIVSVTALYAPEARTALLRLQPPEPATS